MDPSKIEMVSWDSSKKKFGEGEMKSLLSQCRGPVVAVVMSCVALEDMLRWAEMERKYHDYVQGEYSFGPLNILTLNGEPAPLRAFYCRDRVVLMLYMRK